MKLGVAVVVFCFFGAIVGCYELALREFNRRALAPEIVTAATPESPESVTTLVGSTVEEPVTRVLVDDDRLRELEAENAELQQRITDLEATAHPTDRASLAVVLGISETDLDWRLERSVLFDDSAKLAESVRRVGAKKVWEALSAEVEFGQTLFHFKAKNPPQNGLDDATWHYTVWCPFVRPVLEQVTSRLYTMGLPPAIVEAFHTRFAEGL